MSASRPKGDESPSLPDELIWKILLMVPVRSLVRFKCVCKSWNSLISDPQFTHDHIRTSTNQSQSMIIFRDSKIISYSVESLLQNHIVPRCFKTSDRLFDILGSCNGLVCLHHINQYCLTLWNPSIGFTSKRFPIFHAGLIAYHGLGYDHVNDKYKLLLVTTVISETVTKIYTLGANYICSRVIQDLPCDPDPIERLGIFVSGTLNWIAIKSGKQGVILSFDLGTETYGQVLQPRDTDSDNVCSTVINVLRNCLCLCFFDRKKAHWAVWLMKEYGVQDSWTKLMIIPRIDELNRGPWPSPLCPLCFSENGVAMLRTEISKLVVYNSNDGRFEIRRNFCSYHLSLDLSYRECYWSCLESLISPPR